jgi:hypothetical protein
MIRPQPLVIHPKQSSIRLLIFLSIGLIIWPGRSFSASVDDALAGVQERLIQTLSKDELIGLEEEQLLSLLTEDEREVLGNSFIEVSVDVPVEVYVLRSVKESGQVFWLNDRGFEKTDLTATVGMRTHEIWKKDFEPGRIGLGINTFLANQDPCFFVISPREPSSGIDLKIEFPDYVTTARAEPGTLAYTDDLIEINALPDEMISATLVQPKRWDRNHARLINLFRRTKYPSGPQPDQVVLTWSEDPRTSQTVQWRTGPGVSQGSVAYLKKSDHHRFSPRRPDVVEAVTVAMNTPDIVNDPLNYRHTAVIRGLEPDTAYLYSVGDGSEAGWTGFSEFRTAPDRVRSFSFVYMGDVQNGIARWRSLIETAFRSRPDAAFYLIAGDIVNRGVDRDDWDDFFFNGASVFRQRQLVPVIGNHEGQGADRHPTMYLDLFDLPENGPSQLEPERAYSFTYGDVLFLVLDSMLRADSQTAWMEEELKASDAAWKIVTFHFPVFSAYSDRDFKALREAWVPVFDRYQVDLVLQGHDHVYARSFPLKANEIVDDPSQGTTYVVAYAGTKSYDRGQTPHSEVQFDGVSTYQVIDIQVSGDRLLYRA